MTPFHMTSCNRESYDELLHFLNRAFKKEEDYWFLHHLGNIYRQPEKMTDEEIGYTYVVKDKGKIVASIGIFPLMAKCCIGTSTIPIKLGGIGSVAVDASYRGKGLMTTMLKETNHILRENGYLLSWLVGNKFRYANYGWDMDARRIEYIFDKKTTERLINLYPTTASRDIRLATKEDIPHLNSLYETYNNAIERDTQAWTYLISQGHFKLINRHAYICFDPDHPQYILEGNGSFEHLLELYKTHMESTQSEHLFIESPIENTPLTGLYKDHCDDYRNLSCGRLQLVNAEELYKYIKEPLMTCATYLSPDKQAQLGDLSARQLLKILIDPFTYGAQLDYPLPTLGFWIPAKDRV